MKLSPVLRGLLLLCLALAVSAVALPAPVKADTAEEIQAKIDAQNSKIIALEKEIAQYQDQLVSLGSAKSTLQGEITRLDTSRKKLSADISITNSKIEKANLTIAELSDQIVDKEGRIEHAHQGIESSLRSLHHEDDNTIVERYLTSIEMAQVWEDIDRIQTLQATVRNEIASLTELKTALTDNRDTVSAEKSKLAAFKLDLVGQKTLLDQNRAQQAALLTQTKNKESEYQNIVAQKKAAKLQFEQELQQYESQLKYTLNTAALPPAGTGLLSFPLDPTFMSQCKNRQNAFKNLYCITQYFGNTAFAQSGAYNGAGHNGVDFGAPEGTKVVAALSGTVQATGNTDLYKGCYSYGKWVLIQHGNGLSTLYAHLSYIAVGQGDAVPTGALLGYSGKTGYATGPHLHFTLYASDAVKIVRLGDIKAKTNCAGALVPVAATSGYLNPMTYL